MNIRTWTYLASVGAMALAAPAFAQDVSADEPAPGEIVVTAQKRETVLQETPLAITAIGGEGLAERGIDSASELGMLVPGANFSTNGGATSITVRGVGSDSLSQPKDDPSVAAHLDGVYLARPASLAAMFYDIQRVEVLRGPQGTLYGRNATGGALNIITRAPTQNWEMSAQATVGNYDLIDLRGVVNVPLTETLSFRGSTIYTFHKGYSNQLNPAFRNGDDADDTSFRATLAWDPSTAVSVQLRANLYDSKTSAATRTLLDTRSLIGVRDANGVAYGSTTGAIIVNRSQLPGGSDPRAIRTVFPDRQHIKSNTYSGTVEIELSDAFSLRSITGYTDFLQDRRGSSRPFLPAAVNTTFDFLTMSETFTQEVNLNYDSGPLSVVLGGFYLSDDGVNLFEQIPVNPAGVVTIESDQTVKSKSFAAFSEINYKILDSVTLTGGIRYTTDKKEGGSLTRVVVPFQAPIAVPLVAEADNDSVDFKLGVDWKASEDVFLYLNYSTAFKSGGFNTGLPINRYYAPEKLRAWQGGLRTEWLDRTLRVNLDAYHYSYENPQITQVLGTSLETQNATDAEVYGAELSIDYRPSRRLTLSAQASYAHSEYGDALISDILDLNAFGQTVFGRIQIGGNQLRFTPEWTVGVGLDYTVPITSVGTLAFRGNYFWQDESYARPHNLPIDRIDSYSLLNASVRLTSEGNKMYVEVFGDNLLDETIVSARFVNPLHLVEYRPPVTYGLRVGFNF